MSCKILAGNYHRYDFAFWLQFSTTRSSKQQTARYFFILFVTKNAKVSLMIYSPSPTRLHTRARSVMAFASFPWLWCCGSPRLCWLCCPLWSTVGTFVRSAAMLSTVGRCAVFWSAFTIIEGRACRHQLQRSTTTAGRRPSSSTASAPGLAAPRGPLSLLSLHRQPHTTDVKLLCCSVVLLCEKRGLC